MTAYIIRRLIYTVIVFVLVSVLAFSIIQLSPGDPARAMLGDEAPPEQVEALRKALWLDRPLYIQYAHWLGNVLKGDFGWSIIESESTTRVISRALPVTLYLSAIAYLFSIIIGIAIGIVSAVRPGTLLDNILVLLATLGMATPIFWLALILIFVFAYHLGWLPFSGFIWPTVNLGRSLMQMIMPAICLALPSIAVLARQTRSSMLEVIRQDYIRTAKAKGLKEWKVTLKHALKNALIPVVTLMGVHVRVMISGSVLVETVFNIPGMGRLLVEAAMNKDFLVVQACVLVISAVTCLANLLVDISYGWLDPRIQYQ